MIKSLTEIRVLNSEIAGDLVSESIDVNSETVGGWRSRFHPVNMAEFESAASHAAGLNQARGEQVIEDPNAVGDNVARSMTKIMAGNVGMMALAVFTGVITARSLMPAGRGEVAAILSLVLYISLAGSLGNWTGLAWIEAKQPEKSKEVLGAAFLAIAVLGAATIGLAQLFLPLLFWEQSAELVSAARWLVPLVVPVMMFESSNELMVGRQRFGRVSFNRFIRPLWQAVGISGLWLFGQVTVTNVVLVTGLSYLVVGLGSYISLVAESGATRPSRAIIRESVQFGTRIFGGIISQKSNHELDLMIMPALVSPEIIGVYVVAVSAAAIVSGGFSHLRQLVFGIVSRGNSGDHVEIIEFTGRLTLLGATAVAGGLYLFAPFLVDLVYGHGFVDAVLLLRVLLPGVVALAFTEVLFGALASLDRPLWATYPSLVGLAVTIVGLGLTVKPFGAMGAAVTTTVAYLVMMFATMWYAEKVGIRSKRLFSVKLLMSDIASLTDSLTTWLQSRGGSVALSDVAS